MIQVSVRALKNGGRTKIKEGAMGLLSKLFVSFKLKKTIENSKSDDFRLSMTNMWTEEHQTKDGGSFEMMRLKDNNIVFISVGITTVKIFVTPKISDLTQYRELKEFALANSSLRLQLSPQKRYEEDLLILEHLRLAIAWPKSVKELSTTLYGIDHTLQVNA